MSNYQICSVCLTEDARIHFIVSVQLRLLYVRLASPQNPLFPGMHIQMCNWCHSAFKKIYKFSEVATKSYHFLKRNHKYNSKVPMVSKSQEKDKIFNLSVTTIPSISINEESDNTSFCKNITIKQENIEPDEALTNITEKDSKQHAVQSNINAVYHPIQITPTTSPLNKKRIAVKLSLPPNHKIKKITKPNINPAQNSPIVKCIPISRVISKNRSLYTGNNQKKVILTMQSVLKSAPKLEPQKTNIPSLKPKEISQKKVGIPYLKKSTPSQVPITVANTIPSLIPNATPITSTPSLVPLSAMTSALFPISASSNSPNDMMISFTASSPTTGPTLVPLTFLSPNSTLPHNQNQLSEVLASPSIPTSKQLIWHNAAPSSCNKGNIISQRIQAKSAVKKKDMPIYYITNTDMKQNKNQQNITITKRKPILLRKPTKCYTNVNKKPTLNANNADIEIEKAVSKPLEADDTIKTAIENSTSNGNNSDANMINDKKPKYKQIVSSTGVMNYVKIAPKPYTGKKKSTPSLTQPKEVEMQESSSQNKNTENYLKMNKT